MWHAMFVIQIPVLEKILRTFLAYATILVLFRLAGKRGLANLNTLDFIVIFLLSNVVQNAIIGSDDSVSGGVIGAVTLIGLNVAVNRLVARSPRVARVLEGKATVVIRNGAPVAAATRRLGLRPDDLEHVVRTQHGDAMSEIQSGVLEPSGQLILTLKDMEQGATKQDIADILTRIDALHATISQPIRHAG